MAKSKKENQIKQHNWQLKNPRFHFAKKLKPLLTISGECVSGEGKGGLPTLGGREVRGGPTMAEKAGGWRLALAISSGLMLTWLGLWWFAAARSGKRRR